MRALGITCASDMMTGRFDLLRELEAYRLAASRGCKIRTRLYMQWSPVFGPKAVDRRELDARISALDPTTCRVAGAKIFADGAIGSATAAIYGRYSGEPAQGPVLSRHMRSTAGSAPEGVETDGQLIYSPDRLKKMVRVAHDAGYPIAIHSIGDYSTDLVMAAFEAVGDASRHRVEHAMLLSDAQIVRMAELRCFCTMQPEFLLRFGHAYLRQLGPEKRFRLKRARSVIDAGIPLSFNSDRPIVDGDPWDGILTAERRPEGFDQAENVTRLEALRAYTVEGARVNGDKDMGELRPGQLADFQLYDEDPLIAPRPVSLQS
jgi:predicted amidohydrolase YtcJ